MMDDENPLSNFCDNAGFFNKIKKGTRFNPITFTTSKLDVILTLCLSSFLCSEVFSYPNSDHMLVVSIFYYKSRKCATRKVSSRCLNSTKLDEIKNLLKVYPFGPLEMIDDVNTKWLSIKCAIIDIIDKVAPFKQVSIKSKSINPWFDRDLLKLSRKRCSAYKKALNEKSQFSWLKFKQVNALFSKKFKDKKKVYYNELVSSNLSNRSVWQELKPFIYPVASNSTSEEMKINGRKTSSLSLICAEFASRFSCLDFLSFDNNLKNCFDFIKRIFESSFLNTGIENEFDFLPVTNEEVLALLKRLDKLSSPGNCGIPSSILKHCAEELSKPICSLFNLCVRNSEVPNDWKVAIVKPHYKGKGEKDDFENYRPISILSPLRKVFEACLAKRIKFYFESNKILVDEQFGFRKLRSCEHALTSIIEDWRFELDKRKIVTSMFIDLRKAFDTVNHDLLLEKLSRYNFSRCSVNLIKNYLQNRFFRVQIKDTLSNLTPIKIGVPQGSILGPLLFLIYINDLCKLQLSVKICLFADDTTVYSSSKTFDESTKILCTDMLMICDWFTKNRLVINWSKTKAMFINRNATSLPDHLKISGNDVEFVNSFKLLGVLIDSQLNFSNHIKLICRKANAKFHILNRQPKLFTINFKTTLFKLFILPNFDYCSTIKGEITKLESCFNRLIRRFLNLPLSRSDFDNSFLELSKVKLVPLRLRFFQRYARFVFRVFYYANVPTLLFRVKKCARMVRHPYIQPEFHSRFGEHSFSNLSVKLLNKFIDNFLNLLINNFSDQNESKFCKFLNDNLLFYYKFFENFSYLYLIFYELFNFVRSGN